MNPARRTTEHRAISIPVEGVVLQADLSLPVEARGVVLFAHGSGSSRHSPRNRYVAGVLNEKAFATVLADLLTSAEEREDQITARLRFNIDLLARRLTGVADWLAAQPFAHERRLGVFGASTGAAAALITAAQRPAAVNAVVSRGGRPDLAAQSLGRVQAPTLLIVGGHDTPVLQMNRNAQALMKCRTELEIVPGASHLFEEPGTLEEVARLAAEWFLTYLQ